MQTILLSRTDAIGDVVLTLPLAGLLKAQIPGARIVVLCASYTVPVVRCCTHVDTILDWTQLAQEPEHLRVQRLRDVGADTILHVFPRVEIARAAWKARIPRRIGTTHRLYHFRYCNKLVGLGRKHSPHHEARLNALLAHHLLPEGIPPTGELWRSYGMTRIPELPEHLRSVLRDDRFNLILHAKSRGSACEWELLRWKHLIGLLPADRFNILLTGTQEEGVVVRQVLEPAPHVHDLMGSLTLQELIACIHASDGVVAASTGPLHLAAALGRRTLGLFPDRPPLHPGRWGPLGAHASTLQGTADSAGTLHIDVESVFKKVIGWLV